MHRCLRILGAFMASTLALVAVYVIVAYFHGPFAIVFGQPQILHLCIAGAVLGLVSKYAADMT